MAKKHLVTIEQKAAYADREHELYKRFKEGTLNPRAILDGLQHLLEGGSKWREHDDVIYFSITSDGTTGEQWIKRLESKGFDISDYSKSLLRSPDFKPTNGVMTEIAMLEGGLFSDSDRVTRKIREEAERRSLAVPNAEVACLIREKFSDKEFEAMGLWWILIMHEPIGVSDGSPRLLGVRRDLGGRKLDALCGSPDYRWFSVAAFVFSVPQVSSYTSELLP